MPVNDKKWFYGGIAAALLAIVLAMPTWVRPLLIVAVCLAVMATLGLTGWLPWVN